MKTIASIAAVSALALAAQVSAAPLDLNVLTVDNTAYISVTENGHPASDVSISVDGNGTHTVQTSKDGSVIVTNFDNASTYTFSVQQDDGSVLSEKRFLSRQD